MKEEALAAIVRVLQLEQLGKLNGKVEGRCPLSVEKAGQYVLPVPYKCVKCGREDYNNCDVYKDEILKQS